MFYLSGVIGDGSDAEGNEFRPAIALYTDTWTCIADGRLDPTLAAGRMIVRADPVPEFDADPRIQELSRSLLVENGVPDDEEIGDALAEKVVRRFKIRQLLGANDLPADLSLTIGDISPAKLQAIRQRLEDHGLDFSSITLSMTIAGALRELLPQIKVRLQPGVPRPSGTFNDDFTETTTQDLAAHTPSGGTAWTRIDGSVDDAKVTTVTNSLRNNTSDTSGALYQCDDQGSPDHYVDYLVDNKDIGAFTANRATDRSNFIGVRSFSSKLQLFKRVTGTFTQLGSDGTTTVVQGDTARLESDSADAHEAFLNTVSEIGPVTDTFNNTESRQGVVARFSGNALWMDDFEAGLVVFTSANLALNHSGGSDIGGAIGTELTDDTLNNLWDDVSSGDASAGDTEFRCTYVKNTHSSLSVANVKVEIDTDPTESNWEIGLGAAGKNGTETEIVDEDTAPAGVTFGTSALNLGTLASGDFFPIWIKRIVIAGAGAATPDIGILRISGDDPN